MKTYIGKLLLQMAIIWMLLSSCFLGCRTKTNSKKPGPDITLEKPSSEDLVLTPEKKWSAEYRNFFNIMDQYPQHISH